MKNRIKLTESQLKKVISKIIREELINELDDRTMQNALLKTKHTANRQGQHKRMSKIYADKFFNQFLRKKMLGGRFERVELNAGELDSDFHQKDVSDVDFDKSFDIIISPSNNSGLFAISYDNQTDSVNVEGDEFVTINRSDALLLSKMISGYAPETKFKTNRIHQNFTLRNNVDESKLTESQLKKVIAKIIKEELISELDDKTVQNAILKTRYDDRMGQHNRVLKLHADKFFKQFIGKKLEIGTITSVDLDIQDKKEGRNINNPTEKDYDKSFIITIRKEDGEHIKCTYSEQGDNLSLDGVAVASEPMSRRDAILLSKMVSTYNPETKYKINQLHRNFRVSNNIQEAKLDKLIEQYIREELVNELDNTTMQNALLKTKHNPKRQGQHNRIEKNYSSRIFDKFIGAEVLGGYVISKIELNLDNTDPEREYEHEGDIDKSFDITISGTSRPDKTHKIGYDHPSDSLIIGDTDSRHFHMSRKDAILLSKIVGTYNPLTKYKINNINNTFIIKDNL